MNISAIEEFDELQNQMNEFSTHFEVALTQKRSNIINDKQLHYVKVNEIKNQETQLQSEIDGLRQKEEKIKNTIKKTMEDLQFQKLKVEELASKQDNLIEEKAKLQAGLDELHKSIHETNIRLTMSQSSLAEQVRRDYPELQKYERYLGLKIEVVGADSLKFVFNNVDPADLDKEVWCELLVGGEQFQLGQTSPTLASDIVNIVEGEFNQHKEFVKFLKTIRTLLIDALQ